MTNPWEIPAPDYYRQFTDTITVCGVQDRIEATKRMTAAELQAAIDWPGTGLTVKKAAERRLRRLQQNLHAPPPKHHQRGLVEVAYLVSLVAVHIALAVIALNPPTPDGRPLPTPTAHFP